MKSDDIFRLITTIPWGHNQRIIFKCKDVRAAVFYAQYTLENNWSRDVLEHQYELSNALSKEYQRSLPTIETLESEVAKMMDTK